MGIGKKGKVSMVVGEKRKINICGMENWRNSYSYMNIQGNFLKVLTKYMVFMKNMKNLGHKTYRKRFRKTHFHPEGVGGAKPGQFFRGLVARGQFFKLGVSARKIIYSPQPGGLSTYDMDNF